MLVKGISEATAKEHDYKQMNHSNRLETAYVIKAKHIYKAQKSYN